MSTAEKKLWVKLENIDHRLKAIEDRRNTLYATRERVQAQLLAEQRKNERRS